MDRFLWPWWVHFTNCPLHQAHNLTRQIGALTLGIAFMLSCSSPSTSSVHLVSVNPFQLLSDISSSHNTSIINETSPGVEAAFTQVNDLLTNNASLLPQTYTFGISGHCRTYSKTSTKCTKSFPEDPDILTTILSELSSTSNGHYTIDPMSLVSPNFASMQQSYITSSKAYSAVFVAAIVLTFVNTILMQLFPHHTITLLLSVAPGAMLAIGATVVWMWCVVIQMGTYELSSPYAAISFGPGAILLWIWTACVMCLTPLIAMISIIVVTAVLFLCLWAAFVLIMMCIAMAMCVGGGGGSDPHDPYDPNYPNYPS